MDENFRRITLYKEDYTDYGWEILCDELRVPEEAQVIVIRVKPSDVRYS